MCREGPIVHQELMVVAKLRAYVDGEIHARQMLNTYMRLVTPESGRSGSIGN